MENLFSGSLISLSWLISYTRDISILICMIFLIKFIAGKRLPAWWSYSLWLILLVRMLIPWRIENRLNISNLLNIEIDADIMRLMFMGNETGTIDLTTAASSSSTWWQGWNLSLDQTLILLWLAGAVAFGIYILMKNTMFWVMIKGRAKLIENRTLVLLEECKDRLKINRSIDIIITDKVKSPALFGYFHPRLLLPEGILEDFSDDEIVYVFMHELSHMNRHDIAVSCLITFFQIIHWFNPLVWLAFYQMRIDQESACDSSVLSRLRDNQSVEYASATICFLEKYCQNRQLPSMAGILENKTQMKRRLTMIINHKKLSSKMMAMAVVLLITTGFVFFTLTGFAEIKIQGEMMTESGQKALVEASEALQANDYAAAEKILEDYLAANPAYKPDILYQILGTAYLNQKKFYDAADVFEAAYEIYPDRTDFLVNQAQCIVNYAQENDDKQAYIEAAELFERSFEITPGEELENLKSAALCYFSGENYKEAKRVFERADQVSGGTDINVIKALYQISKYLEQPDDAGFYARRLDELGESSSVPSASSDTPKVEQKETGKGDYTGNAFGLDEVDTAPRVITSVPPQYPFLAKRDNIQGRVIVQFIVTKEGAVREAKITESDPEGMFDEAAIAAIEQYIFEPATKDGEPVDCIVHAPMAFQLK